MSGSRRGRDQNIRIIRTKRQRANIRLFCSSPVLPKELEVDSIEYPNEGTLLRHSRQEAPVLGYADPAERSLVRAEDGRRARHPRLVDLHHERRPCTRPQAAKDGERAFPPETPETPGIGKRGNSD